MMLLTKCSLAKSVPIVIPNVRGVLPAWANSCSDPGGRQGRLLPSFYSQEAAKVTALVTCTARSDPESLGCHSRGADCEGAAEGLGDSWCAQIQMQRLPGVGCRGPGGVRGRREGWLGRNGAGCGWGGLWGRGYWAAFGERGTRSPSSPSSSGLWALKSGSGVPSGLPCFSQVPVAKFPLLSELVSLSVKWW